MSEIEPPNKFLQSDKIVLSCLLLKTQKPSQHAFAAEERRYKAAISAGVASRPIKLGKT